MIVFLIPFFIVSGFILYLIVAVFLYLPFQIIRSKSLNNLENKKKFTRLFYIHTVLLTGIFAFIIIKSAPTYHEAIGMAYDEAKKINESGIKIYEPSDILGSKNISHSYSYTSFRGESVRLRIYNNTTNSDIDTYQRKIPKAGEEVRCFDANGFSISVPSECKTVVELDNGGLWCSKNEVFHCLVFEDTAIYISAYKPEELGFTLGETLTYFRPLASFETKKVSYFDSVFEYYTDSLVPSI